METVICMLVDWDVPATVIEYMSPAPAVSLSVPNQQTTVTDDLEEFTEPVYDQVHQEQFAAGEMTENIVEIPVVQEQVIVQAIPEVVVSLPPVEEFTGPGFNQVHMNKLLQSLLSPSTSR